VHCRIAPRETQTCSTDNDRLRTAIRRSHFDRNRRGIQV
jgi:hypothetical protein